MSDRSRLDDVDNDATLAESKREEGAPRDDATAPALLIAWSRHELHRAGEVLLCHPQRGVSSLLIGRGDGPADPPAQRARFVRQRPGFNVATRALASPHLSRSQLLVHLGDDPGGVDVESVGQLPLRVGGRQVQRCRLAIGEVACIGQQMSLLCVRRPWTMPHLRFGSVDPAHAFGEADPDGLVGESLAAWALRDRIAFMDDRQLHVLVQGPSGAGKELVVRALHGRSSRRGRPLVSRNAATLPEGLIEAELFGNIRNYPNPGTPERPGLVGEADGSTLFLDEIGELPEALQARLLRLLDGGGEYQRLGEAAVRKADIRLIGATNRDADALKHDVLARLKLRLEVPSLRERQEDVPLLARHLLTQAARRDPLIRKRFFTDGAPELPRVEVDLVAALLRYDWPLNVRELESALWQAMSDSPGDALALTPALADQLQPAASETPAVEPEDLSREAIVAALEAAGGVQNRAWKDLGLRNRFQLRRLMEKHGIQADKQEG